MALTAKLLRAGIGFEPQGMTVGVYCQLTDDVAGELGVRYYPLTDPAIQDQVLALLHEVLPVLEPVVKMEVTLPDNTTLVTGIAPQPVSQPMTVTTGVYPLIAPPPMPPVPSVPPSPVE